MSSGFDSGIAATHTLRSPLLDVEAKRQIAIYRFSTDLLVTRGPLVSRRDDAFRIIYDGEFGEIILSETQFGTNRSAGASVPASRSASFLRPYETQRRAGKNEIHATETERRVGVLDVSGTNVTRTDREPPTLERGQRLLSPEPGVALNRSKHARAWRPEPAASGASGWDRNRLDNEFGHESRERTRNPSETESDSTDEVSALTALSSEALAAFYGAEAIAAGQYELIDADVLAAVMMRENTAGNDRSIDVEMEGARFSEVWDQTSYFAAVDCALSSVSEEPISDTHPTAQAQTTRLQAGPVTAQSDEQKQVSMAVAAAVVVASRVESNRSQTRGRQKSRGLGWLGAVAQFLVTPRFSTPRRPTILLAMRDDLVRERFARVLRDDGYDVVDFGTLSEAAKHVTANWIKLDGAVMDAELDFSGIHLFTKILEKYPKLPVVVCGEAVDNGDMIQYRRLGARRCLLKPVDLSELLATVNALVW